MSVFTLLALLSMMFSSGVQASTNLQANTSPGNQNEVLNLQDGLVVSKAITQAEQKAALAFWKRETIAEAQAMDLMVDFGPAEVDSTVLSSPATFGAAGFAPAGLAAPDADSIAKKSYPRDWAAPQVSAKAAEGISGVSVGDSSPTGTTQVFTSYIANGVPGMQVMYPHRWVGRLSFSTPQGESFCSATSISGNVMLTAAHCLYDSTNNVWYSNWVFSPAYRLGNAPYGTFPATNCWVLTTWVNLGGSYNINTWARHDVGVCKMGTNSAGQTLNNAVGWMGRQWNYPYIRHFHNMGYPFRDFNNALLTNAGLYLRICTSESFQQTAETRGMGCNYGGGISGGPWMIGYAPQFISGFADGVNSGIFTGTRNIYGARFNSSNIVPLCNAAVC
jgi:hypothetical protein